MDLNIHQALQKGIAAHKEGNLKDAEYLYRSILKIQPTHPDANHNLGILLVSLNKANMALPMLKNALKANPTIEQFWLSYIDSLIKTKKFDDVRQVLSNAKQAGVTVSKLQILENQFQQKLSTKINKPYQLLNNQLQNYQNKFSIAIGLREVGKYKEAIKWQ